MKFFKWWSQGDEPTPPQSITESSETVDSESTTHVRKQTKGYDVSRFIRFGVIDTGSEIRVAMRVYDPTVSGNDAYVYGLDITLDDAKELHETLEKFIDAAEELSE